MQRILNQKIIMHNIKSMKENLEQIEKIALENHNLKAQKKILVIKKELENLEFYYKAESGDDNLNFPIKKQITIKNKKASSSFAKWLFNNNER